MSHPARTPHAEIPGASVPFPPPLAFIVGIIVGFTLHALRPVSVSARSGAVLQKFGWAFLALSVCLVVSAVVAFRRARTSPTFSRASASLIVHGPFRISRNPLYLAAALLHLGLALTANALWPLLLLLPALVIVNVLIKREEGYLSRRFGVEYDEYRRRVRRWV